VRVRATLAAGLALLAIGVALTLKGSAVSVAASNVPPGADEEPITATKTSASYCQDGERLPRGASAIRLWLAAAMGPRVRVTVSRDGRPLTGGQHPSGWSGGSVTVPVRPLSRAVADVRLCASFALRDEAVVVQGSAAPAAVGLQDGGQRLAGRMWVEYLRPGSRSWASLIPSILRHMGFGHAAPGEWSALAALALIVSALVLAFGAAHRELR
jgi:hypothetical protein